MRQTFYLIIFTVLIISCNEYTPKPPGYFRISFPEHEYQTYESGCPYSFDYPNYANIQMNDKDSCWVDVVFPRFKSKIHLTYRNLNGNAIESMEDSRALVYKHTVKADAIGETVFSDSEKNVHGILYEIKGNAASSLQFFVTDSTAHFVRGALYFDASPNKDSLAPVVDFLKKDIQWMMESFEWK